MPASCPILLAPNYEPSGHKWSSLSPGGGHLPPSHFLALHSVPGTSRLLFIEWSCFSVANLESAEICRVVKSEVLAKFCLFRSSPELPDLGSQCCCDTEASWRIGKRVTETWKKSSNGAKKKLLRWDSSLKWKTKGYFDKVKEYIN